MSSRFALIVFAVVMSSVFVLVTPQPAEARGRLSFNGHFNKDHAGVKFSRIVVAAPNVVPAFRRQIEKRFQSYVRKFSRGATEAVRIAEVIPPKPSYTPKQVMGQLKKQGIDAAVIIDIQQNLMRAASEANTSVIPAAMPAALKFAASHQHNPAYGAKYQPTRVRVYDLKSGSVVFEGQGMVNATATSRKWHKVSGKFLSVKLAKYLRKGQFYAGRREAAKPASNEDADSD